MDNPGGAAAGWFDFVSCCLEWSGTPLLDLQSAPSLAADIQGLEQVRITDYMNADNTAYTHYGTPGGAPPHFWTRWRRIAAVSSTSQLRIRCELFRSSTLRQALRRAL